MSYLGITALVKAPRIQTWSYFASCGGTGTL